MPYTPDYQIIEDPKFQYLVDERHLKPKTIKNYRTNYILFCKATGYTLSELIDEARREQKEKEYMDQKRIRLHFKTFIKYMEEKEYAPYRIKVAVDNIKSFYNEFEIETPKKSGYKGVPKNYYVLYEDLPQYDDMCRVMNESTPKYRAMFSLMASSGMNYVDAISITVKDLLDAVNYYLKIEKIEEDRIKNLDELYNLTEKYTNIIPAFRMWRIKTDLHHITFCTSECLHFLIYYLQRHTPLSLENPLFRVEGRSNRNTQKAVTHTTVCEYLGRMNKKLGWRDKKIGDFNFITSRSFRVFFANELEDEDVKYRHIRLMMGHATPGVDRNYFKKNAPKLLKSYKQGMHRLTFMEKPTLHKTSDEELELFKKQQEEKDLEYERQRREDAERHAEEIRRIKEENKSDRVTMEWMKKEIMAMKKQKEVDAEAEKLKRNE